MLGSGKTEWIEKTPYLLIFFLLLLFCLDAQVAGEEAGELLEHFGGHFYKSEVGKEV